MPEVKSKPIGRRYIDGERLVEVVERKGINNSRLVRWLRNQPRTPKLVNNQGAADILGIQPTHMSRLRDRLPEPVRVEGTTKSSLYLKSEIEQLRDEIAAERKAKEAAA